MNSQSPPLFMHTAGLQLKKVIYFFLTKQIRYKGFLFLYICIFIFFLDSTLTFWFKNPICLKVITEALWEDQILFINVAVLLTGIICIRLEP